MNQVIDDGSDWLTIHCDTVYLLLAERGKRERKRQTEPEKGRDKIRVRDGENKTVC